MRPPSVRDLISRKGADHFFQPGQGRDADDPQIFLRGQNFQSPLFEIGRSHHLEITSGDEFRASRIQRPVHDNGAAKGRDTVGEKRAAQGRSQSVSRPGRPARIVMLQYDRRGLGRKVLEDIDAVIHIRRILICP